MADIRDPRLLYIKGGLFLLLGTCASVGLLLECPRTKVAVLLGLAVWGFCRAYYFAFYVMTGMLVKIFTGIRRPPMSEMAYLFNNTVGGNLLCLVAVFALGWIPFPHKHGGRWPRACTGRTTGA